LDNEGQSPYLFNPQSAIRIAYEDSISIRLKCEYIQQKKIGRHHVLGLFFRPQPKAIKNCLFSPEETRMKKEAGYGKGE